MLYEAVVCAVVHNDEFKEVHLQFIMRDKDSLKKMQPMIAVACELLRIFYNTGDDW